VASAAFAGASYHSLPAASSPVSESASKDAPPAPPPLLVRQLAPGPEGLPLEIYCFTASTAWVDYETIQSDLFDHLYAVLPEFGLRPFQNPTGADVAHLFGAGAAQTRTAEEGERRQTALA
jgi:hypothetical protein